MKLYSKCDSCKKKRFFIRKRKVTLPNGEEATSKAFMCNPCNTKLQALLARP